MRIGQSHDFWRKYSLLNWVFRIYSSFWRECAEICCFKHRDFHPWCLPSSILTFCLDELLPVTTKTVNLSLESGIFSGDWKNALVHPLLKKAGLQPFNKNLRPVSNVQFMSKIKEKSVALQMQDLMVANGLFPDLQCLYWQNHSSETALVKVRNDFTEHGQRPPYLTCLGRSQRCVWCCGPQYTSTQAAVQAWRGG